MDGTKQLEALLQRIKDLRRDEDEVVLAAVLKNEDDIIRLTTDQLSAGIDGTGQAIVPPYTTTTRRIKARKGQPTNRVTLKDTGAYYRARRIITGNKKFWIVSKDSKSAKLSRKYGPNILELTTASKDEAGEIIRPTLQRTYKKRLHGN